MSELKEKVILITGAAMGLGLATAIEAAASGAKLALVDYNAEGLEKAKADILSQYPNSDVLTIIADTSNEDDVKNYVKETINKFGAIDGFYNNAGIEGKQAPLVDYDLDVFKKVIDINLLGVYYGIKHVLPHMQSKNYGRIVNVASVGGIRGVMNQTPYVASKHAVVGITKNTALEYARYGINTNAIAPGAILTPMVAGAFKQVNPEDPAAAEAEYAQANPTKRLGKPEEVAKVVCFLLSEACSYVNGQVIAIDGGQSNSYGNV
ncbi:glucose 1-dehydrogenase [Mucilaginibacter terrae]|uniref:NAD(P)-dependent dehydrogenase (Short-subunit alcohol dehydrogenase family) n=1 Tax=Mucilaginibacter terrae TaxID=1955052 RepID=A0ABU3GSS2_9SPHI|nr:glucose 1-dehydrogenase [Mucilaginibacter terrae]MDT3402670.1 NAD(P)-dependent dehydrogenase (short-subunit alcohol dehydrogenase family) [Mucilaginibacter terrae]